MKSLKSFHFVIDRDGAMAYLNPEQNLAFGRAEGDFVAPDEARAVIRVISPGILVEVQIIVLGDEYWESGIFSEQWLKLPSGTGFNPATFFDPNSGFQIILQEDILDLQLDGIEELDELPGQSLYVLHGKVDGKRLYDLSYGLIGPETVELRLWITPETFEIQRIAIDELAKPDEISSQGDMQTRWQVDFWNFNQIEPITPPPGEQR